MFRVFPKNSQNSVESLGGKGYNLGILHNISPIPNTLVLSSTLFEKFVEENKLKEILSSILENVDVENYEEIDRVGDEIKKMFLKAKSFPIDLSEVEKEIKNWGNVSVRSSSNYEDLATASFAGQHESYLNVKKEELEGAIRKVWASLYTPRAIMYRVIKKIPHKEVKMAVVIQEMINVEKAGVMFTKNPIKGSEDEIIIEAVFGLGEGLVSGRITPDNYIINKKTQKIIEKNIGEKNIAIVLQEGGGIKEKEINEGAEVLTEKNLNDLIKEAIKIDKHFGKPQDIEWAIDKEDKVWILQSRDVTV